MSLQPASILAECSHDLVIDDAAEVVPFRVHIAWVVGLRVGLKFPLKAVSEALGLYRVGSATGVNARATLGLGMVDLSRLQSDLAAYQGMVHVTVCAVVTSREKDSAEVRSPGDDEVWLVPVAGPGVSPRHLLLLFTREESVCDAEAVVTTKFQQPLTVLIHPADAEVAEAGWLYLPVGSNAFS